MCRTRSHTQTHKLHPNLSDNQLFGRSFNTAQKMPANLTGPPANCRSAGGPVSILRISNYRNKQCNITCENLCCKIMRNCFSDSSLIKQIWISLSLLLNNQMLVISWPCSKKKFGTRNLELRTWNLELAIPTPSSQ